jgi:uncharacterized iron-regulated membrane protein
MTVPTPTLKQRIHRFLWWIHWSLGLGAGAILALVSLSGALIAFEPQIVAWSESKQRILPHCIHDSQNSMANPSKIETLQHSLNAWISHPHIVNAPDQKATGWTLWADSCRTALMHTQSGNIYVNPNTGTALGSESKIHGFLHGVEEFHRWLLVQKPGKQIVGAATLIFGILLCTGLLLSLLPLWRNRRKMRTLGKLLFPKITSPGFASPNTQSDLQNRPKSKPERRKIWVRSWHIAIGIWLFLPMLLTMLTGVMISYEWAGKIPYWITGTEAPTKAPSQGLHGSQGSQGSQGAKHRGQNPAHQANQNNQNNPAKTEIPWASVAQALRPYLDSIAGPWKSISLRSPRKAGDPLMLVIQHSGEGPNPRSTLRLSPEGKVLKWQAWSQNNAGQSLRSWIVPLHTGQVWGVWGQSLALVTALGVAFLSLSGLWLAYKRWHKKSAAPSIVTADPTPQ